MIVANHHTDNVRGNQADKADKTHIGNDHRAAQTAKQHTHQRQPLYVDTQTDGGLLTTQEGIVIPPPGETVHTKHCNHNAHCANILPAGASQITKGPEYQGGELHLVGKLLDQRSCTGEHGADRHTGQYNTLRSHLAEFG